MIADHIRNARQYTFASDRMNAAIRFIAETDFLSIPPNTTINLEGDELYASIEEYRTKPLEQGLWESHRKYVDIHYVLKGTERIGYANAGGLAIEKEYVESGDYLLYRGVGNMIVCTAGMFLILFPDDAHMPGIAFDTPAGVTKVIMKIRI